MPSLMNRAVRSAAMGASGPPLTRLSAIGLAARIRRRELTSVEVVDAHIAVLKRIADRNALAAERFDQAREEAEAADAKIAAGAGDAAAAARGPGDDQGAHRGRRHAAHRRLPAPAQVSRSGRRAGRGPAARRRCDRARRRKHARPVLLARDEQQDLRTDVQRLRPLPHGGRLVRRRLDDRRLRWRTGRARFGHGRLDPRPGVRERHLRPPALARAGADHRALPHAVRRYPPHAVHRPAHAPRRGSGARAADHRRPGRPGPLRRPIGRWAIRARCRCGGCAC